MKNILIITFILLGILNANSQNLEQDIARLKAENDSLTQSNKELTRENTLLSAYYWMKMFEKNEEVKDENVEKEIINPYEYIHRIKLNNPKAWDEIFEMMTRTDSLIDFIDSLKMEMENRTGGVDTIYNTLTFQSAERGIYDTTTVIYRPIGYRNRKIVQQVMIEEGNGKELKVRIDNYRKYLLKFGNDSGTFIEKIKIDKPSNEYLKAGKKWEEYYFGSMPLAAVLPIFAKFKNDIKESEIKVLKYLSEN